MWKRVELFFVQAESFPPHTGVSLACHECPVCQQELARMARATVLVLSSDLSLIESCQGVITSVGALRPTVLPLSEDLGSYLRRKDVALILIHVVDKRDTENASRLLREVASMQRPVATVLLGEQHDPEQALTLLRQEAAG